MASSSVFQNVFSAAWSKGSLSRNFSQLVASTRKGMVIKNRYNVFMMLKFEVKTNRIRTRKRVITPFGVESGVVGDGCKVLARNEQPDLLYIQPIQYGRCKRVAQLGFLDFH